MVDFWNFFYNGSIHRQYIREYNGWHFSSGIVYLTNTEALGYVIMCNTWKKKIEQIICYVSDSSMLNELNNTRENMWVYRTRGCWYKMLPEGIDLNNRAKLAPSWEKHGGGHLSAALGSVSGLDSPKGHPQAWGNVFAATVHAALK